jgi:hemerythrin-like domain-containing protein
MEATDILMSEHRVIERVITTLETAAHRLENGQDVRPGFFVDAADFNKGFGDGCHHKKEENVLFKALVKNGMSEKQGPVAVMLYEHTLGRQYTAGMRDAALKLQEGDASAKGKVIHNALGYAGLLRQHIQKEDNMLFPMAAKIIPEMYQAQVTEAFEQVEHEETGEGVHEKYLALAEALEKEMQQA